MLENFHPSTDSAKRQLYVAMTRAKQNLFLHLNGNYLQNIVTENLTYTKNTETFSPPRLLAMHLSHKDVWLDYYQRKQHPISKLTAGDELILGDNLCLNSNGQIVMKFSKQFAQKIESMRESGYHLKSARVNFIVFWQKEGSEKEVKIILPEVFFEKKAT